MPVTGTYLRNDGRPVVRFDRTVPASDQSGLGSGHRSGATRQWFPSSSRVMTAGPAGWRSQSRYDSADKPARDSAGWEACLDGLESWLGGSGPERPMRAAHWQAYYEEYRRRGLPATAPLPD